LKLLEKLEQQAHELDSLRKHYDSIEQSNDNAYMALQITEIEAKNELNRVTIEYQVKHQREVDELKHVILQLQEDKQVLESSVAYNKTKYIQAQVSKCLLCLDDDDHEGDDDGDSDDYNSDDDDFYTHDNDKRDCDDDYDD
jgi:hypothetical protein